MLCMFLARKFKSPTVFSLFKIVKTKENPYNEKVKT